MAGPAAKMSGFPNPLLHGATRARADHHAMKLLTSVFHAIAQRLLRVNADFAAFDVHP